MPRGHTMRAFALFSLLAAPLFAQTPPTSHEILKTGPEWVNGIAEPASGRFIVYADEHALKIYNRQSHRTASVLVTVAGPPNAVSISRSGQRVIFPVADDGKGAAYIWAIDLDTLTGNPVTEPHRISAISTTNAEISADGRWVAFATLDRNVNTRTVGARLLVMPSDGGEERMLDSAMRIQTPHWSHDGKNIFYVRGRGNGPGLARIAASGGKADSLAPANGVIGVSPDDRLVALVVNARASQASVQIVDTKGAAVGRFQFTGDDDRPYAWSVSEPSQLLFSRRLQPATLKTVSIADGSVKNFPGSEPYPKAPRFSPNGSRLGVIGRIDGRDQFVVFDAKGGQRRVVSTAVQPERRGWHWSPDGSHIAFLATDANTLHHELHMVDVATTRESRLVDLGAEVAGNATLYRWRSDGKAIDYITGATPLGQTGAELHRVDLSGSISLIRSLPAAKHGSNTDGGYRLVNDSLVVIGVDCGGPCKGTESLLGVPIPSGEPRTLATHAAYWLMSMSYDIGSPDGKWVTFGSVGVQDAKDKPQWAIASLDGKTFRVLGEPMGCDVWPVQWLPDSRSFIAVGAASCADWHEQLYQVPIDGSMARHIPLPAGELFTLTPDGKSVLVAVDDQKQGSIVAYDLAKLVSARR